MHLLRLTLDENESIEETPMVENRGKRVLTILFHLRQKAKYFLFCLCFGNRNMYMLQLSLDVHVHSHHFLRAIVNFACSDNKAFDELLQSPMQLQLDSTITFSSFHLLSLKKVKSIICFSPRKSSYMDPLPT